MRVQAEAFKNATTFTQDGSIVWDDEGVACIDDRQIKYVQNQRGYTVLPDIDQQSDRQASAAEIAETPPEEVVMPIRNPGGDCADDVPEKTPNRRRRR